MSSKVWGKLDPKVQLWVQQAADESSDYQRKLWQEKTVEALDLAKAEGVMVYDVDVSSFAKKVSPMLDEINNPDVRKLLKQISEVK